MEPRQLAEGISIYCGDCREVLPTLKGIAHVISDPPYEDELHEAIGRVATIRNDGQTMCNDFKFAGINTIRPEVSRLITAVSSGWVLLFTLAEGVRAWRDDLQASGAKWDTTLAWVKPDAMPRFNGQGASRGFECIVSAWCGSGYRSWNGGGMRGIFTYSREDRPGGHPTEKPLALMTKLVALYTQPGQTVCDPFMGSGTTGVAAVRLGRKFVGIEIEPSYYEVASKRITDALAQPNLFIPIPSPKPQQVEMFT